MSYEPRPADLHAEELRFLSLVAPAGVDWRKTRADFEARHGTSRHRHWSVITLPPSTALSDTPLQFRMYADGPGDLPPEYLFADFQPVPDARANHAEIERQLTARLGEPRVRDTSNCLVRRWSFGVFGVELHTFPPDLQGAWAARRSPEDRAFENSASVSLHSDYALVFPDGSLEPLGQILAASARAGGGDSFLFVAPPPAALSREPLSRSIRHTRRNPRTLERLVPRGHLVAWRDPAQGRVGISAPGESLVFEPGRAGSLLLEHVHPAKGAGCSMLRLRFGAEGSAGESLLAGKAPDDLDAIAERLARLWSIPLEHESSSDC